MAQTKDRCECRSCTRFRVAGLMSGTSADGIDVAIVDITPHRRRVVAYESVPYPAEIRDAVLRLCSPQRSRVDDICHYNFLLGRLFAEALIKTCRKKQITLKSIDFIFLLISFIR